MSAKIIAIVAAAGFLLAGGAYVALNKERASHQKTMADHAIELAQAKDVALQASESYRKKEQELNDALAQANQAQQKLARERSARAADARTADQRLLDAAHALAAQTRESCPAAGLGPGAGDGPNLLAELFGELARRTTALAEQAETYRQDAQYCRGRYNQAREELRRLGGD